MATVETVAIRVSVSALGGLSGNDTQIGNLLFFPWSGNLDTFIAKQPDFRYDF